MKISESKLRSLIRKALVTEITSGKDFSITFQEWNPGVCNLDPEKTKLFKSIFYDESSGKVLSEANSDGYYFKDSASGQMMEVCGNCVIKYVD